MMKVKLMIDVREWSEEKIVTVADDVTEDELDSLAMAFLHDYAGASWGWQKVSEVPKHVGHALRLLAHPTPNYEQENR